MSQGKELPPALLEEAFRAFPYALFILLAGDRAQATGIIATWAMQVSFHPPLIAAAVEQTSKVRHPIEASRVFSLNFLGAGDRDAATAFLKAPSSAGAMMAGHPLTVLDGAIPALADAALSIGCRLQALHDAGDHVICVGEVADAIVRRQGRVLHLSDTGWKYYR